MSRLSIILSILATALVPALGMPAHGAEDVGEEAAALVGDLHTAFGNHHARAAHAKGVILTGTFQPSAEARSLSKAALFGSSAPVTVRFSDFAGLPGVSDVDPLASPRGFAVRFGAFDNPSLDIVAHSFDGFPTRTAAEFGELLRDVAAAGGGKPEALGTFLAGHPNAKRFLTTQDPPPVSFATTAYFGVNAVRFIAPDGQSRPVRYRFAPAAGRHYYTPGRRKVSTRTTLPRRSPAGWSQARSSSSGMPRSPNPWMSWTTHPWPGRSAVRS